VVAGHRHMRVAAQHLQTRAGIRAVAHSVTQAPNMAYIPLALCVLYHGLKGLQVTVDIRQKDT
jgi:hypothetical protein